jgi:hypothetical protein
MKGGLLMARREDLKRFDITLGESLYDSSREAIARRGFSLKLRLAAKRLTDSLGDSPESVTKKVKRRLPELTKATRESLTKRLTVEFPVEDLYKVDQATQYFKKQGLELSRQDVLRFALLEWPNLQ